MIQLIESEQSNIESKLSSSKHPTYNSIIIPSLQKLLTELASTTDFNSLPTKLTISKPVDIYAEALTTFFIQNPKAKLPIRLITFMLITHPFMLNVVQYGHTFESWDNLRKQLLESIELDFDSLPSAKQMKTLLQQPILDTSQTSAFHNFHYLFGAWFQPNTTGKTPEALKPIISSLAQQNEIKDYILISINASHNVKRKDSIVYYNDVPRSREKIINEDTIQSFASFNYSDVSQHVKTPFDILDSNFKQLQQIPKSFTHSLVLINYNDSDDLETNHYTVAHFGKSSFLEHNQTLDFIAFKSIRSISPQLLSFFLQESFYENIYTNDLNISDLKREYTQLMNTISSTFNSTNDWKSFRTQLIEKVKSQHSDIIAPEEIKYFSIYLTKLQRLPTYDLQSVLSFVLSYVYPDLLTSSSDL